MGRIKYTDETLYVVYSFTDLDEKVQITTVAIVATELEAIQVCIKQKELNGGNYYYMPTLMAEIQESKYEGNYNIILERLVSDEYVGFDYYRIKEIEYTTETELPDEVAEDLDERFHYNFRAEYDSVSTSYVVQIAGDYITKEKHESAFDKILFIIDKVNEDVFINIEKPVEF